MDYESAVLQVNGQEPNNNNTYWRIQINSCWYYFFTDTITFDNLTTNPVQTITLRLDKWGSCVANMNSDFKTWSTQVLATNKEVNVYDFWNTAYSNMSSYTFLKKVYPNLSDIQLVKYTNNQYIFNEQNTNINNENLNGYYYYKINYLVTAYNNTESNSTTYNKLEGNYRDYYTQQVTTPTTSSLHIKTVLPDWVFGNEMLPFISFSPVVSNDESQEIFTVGGVTNYWITKWNFPLLLSLSTDKDVALIQLPFCLTNKGLSSCMEGLVTGNYWLGNGGSANYQYSTGWYWLVSTTTGNNTNAFLTYFISANGVTISNNYCWDSNNLNQWNFSSLINKYGFNQMLINEDWDFNVGSYNLEPFFIMYPMLYNYYSYNISYMGQTVTYNISYVNNVLNLTPFNLNGETNPQPLSAVFSANYPNLSLNIYAQDNILSSSNTPIGQFNLSTAMLPNTTNPTATWQTNEAKIINNAGTLKNLDMSKAMLGYFGGLGLTSLMNPLSLFTGAAMVGLDMESINVNYSNSFGKAKRYELGHMNQLQTAGDNLGSPDNKLTYYELVPALNDIQNIIGQVDKYGYLYNQWDRFNNLFGNYYHNYIKLSQNADIVINTNCILLIKSWQNYMIQQLINGVIIWENYFPNETHPVFVDSWQLYNDCINNKENFGNIANWDSLYHVNFKSDYKTATLMKMDFTVKEPTKEVKPNKEHPQESNIFVWKKL